VDADTKALAPDLAFTSTGIPCVVFFDDAAGEVKFAYRLAPANPWVVETVDSCNASNPHYSLEISDSDRIGISYFGATDDLRYAYKSSVTSGSWAPVTADSAGDVGTYTSLAFDSSTRPRIAYHDVTQNRLKYASGSSSSGGTWTQEVVDATARAGILGVSLLLDEDNIPHIAYSADGPDDLNYAVKGAFWAITGVDTTGSVGRYPSIAMNPAGFPAISYLDTSGNSVNYAEFDGSVWNIAIAYDEDAGFSKTTLVFTPSGQPWIIHLDGGLFYTARGLAPGP